MLWASTAPRILRKKIIGWRPIGIVAGHILNVYIKVRIFFPGLFFPFFGFVFVRVIYWLM